MAKNGKTYSITEAQLEDMIKKASEAGAEAYKKEQSQSTRRKVDRMLYKTKVLLEKYTWLKAYAKILYTHWNRRKRSMTVWQTSRF